MIGNAERRNACQRGKALGLKGPTGSVDVAAAVLADARADAAAVQVAESECHGPHRRTSADRDSERVETTVQPNALLSRKGAEEVKVRALIPDERNGHRYGPEHLMSDSH